MKPSRTWIAGGVIVVALGIGAVALLLPHPPAPPAGKRWRSALQRVEHPR